VDLAAVSQQLQAAGIHASLRGSALRVSPHLYNTGEDLDPLVSILRGAAGG
jgi:selenocysteine lyase/cysteine desulfurase